MVSNLVVDRGEVDKHFFTRLQDETARVEDVLVKESALEALVKCFVSAKANSFENLLDPFLKICRLSKGIAIGVARGQFFQRLVDRLRHSKAVVRLGLLRILKTICDLHPNRTALVERYGIYSSVEKLSRQDGAVLVRELAREILPSLAPVLKPAGKSTDSPSGVAPKKRVPRTPSESSFISDQPGRSSSSQPRPIPSSQTSGRSRQKLGEIQWTKERR